MKAMSILAYLFVSTFALASGSNTVFIERFDVEKIYKIPDSGVVEDKKLEKIYVTVSRDDYREVYEEIDASGEPVPVKIGPYLPLYFDVEVVVETGQELIIAYSMSGTPVILRIGETTGECRETDT